MGQPLYELPEGWEWVELSDVVDILDSRRKPINNKERESRIRNKGPHELYPYYGATGQVGVIDDYIFDDGLLLLGEDGVSFYDPLKTKAYLITGKTWVNNHAHVLRAREGRTTNEFLCHHLNRFDYRGFVSGATRLKLNQSAMKRIHVPLPPLDEQKRIVAKLDALFTRIDAAITHLQETLELSKALFASALDEEFNQELGESDESNVLPFAKVAINHDGKRIPIKASERKKSHGSYPYYGATGVIDYVDDYIFDGERLLISEDGANLVARKYPIAFLASGKYWVNNHAHIVEAIPEITTNHYLELFFAWFDLSGYITGAAQPKLSQKKLNTIPVPVPSLDKQQRIVTHLDALADHTRTLEAETQERLDQLTALKSSLLDSAFRGQL